MTIVVRAKVAFSAFLAALCTAPVAGQCQLTWSPGFDRPGLDGRVFATTLWDPDGPGPLQAVLAAGGEFRRPNVGIATFDFGTQTWTPLGTGVSGFAFGTLSANCLAATPAGLVIGGSFDHVGGVAANCVALWNGSAWQPLGAGLLGLVSALAVLPNGDLLAGGDFLAVGGVGPGGLARWNGTQWSLFAGGANGRVATILQTNTGDIIVGGAFTQVGTQPASSVAIWNGSSWQAFPTAPTGTTNCLAFAANGDLVIGGDYAGGNGLPQCKLARWNGTSWSAIAPSLDGIVNAMARLPTGDLLVGGAFTTDGGSRLLHVARWDGTTLRAAGDGFESHTRSLTMLPNGNVIAGGGGGELTLRSSFVRRYDGHTWTSLPPCTNGPVRCSLRLRNGDLVVGGDFTEIQGVRAQCVAIRTGTQWRAMGTFDEGSVVALHELPNGDIAAGCLGARVTVWHGTFWARLPTLSGFSIFALAGLPNGDLVAIGSGAEPVRVFINGSWQPLGPTPRPQGPAFSAATLANGDLVVGGHFLAAGHAFAGMRYDGTTWSGFCEITQGAVMDLFETKPGELLMGGLAVTPGTLIRSLVWRWDGTTMTPVTAGVGTTDGTVWRMLQLDNGDLIAGGSIRTMDGASRTNLVRWDGSSWSDFVGAPDNTVLMLDRAGSEIIAGGLFNAAGSPPSAFIASVVAPCPAAATSRGNGCNGSNGAIALRADILPWLGGECRSTATGLAPNALALAIVGTQPLQQPLSLAHPAAGAACLQLASADALVTFAPTTGGSATFAIRVPRVASLAGITFHEQVVQVEANAAGTIVALSSTNALALTIGVF